jgi:hypothetical protein
MVKAGDKFLDVKLGKEFIIIEIVNEDEGDSCLIEAENITFKGKFYPKFRNSMGVQRIIDCINSGELKQI